MIDNPNVLWLSQEPGGPNRRRKWPWLLLLLLLLALLIIGAGYVLNESDGIVSGVPAPIQTVLPVLLTDDAMVVYVVDNSGSMSETLLPLHEALHEVANKPTDNSEIALLMFGDSTQLLFDFTEPDTASWDTAIPSFAAQSGGTAMFTALQEAQRMLPDRPLCQEQSSWLLFSKTVCRENRIVLMSDGQASDIEVAQATIDALVQSAVPVDTVAFGVDADEQMLRLLANVTGGSFIPAY